VLEVAGSGSNLPLTRRLLEAWSAQTGQRFVLHPSIGSTGAVHAVRDGAVHVGLLSRPLNAGERSIAASLEQRTYAWSVVVLAAHPSVVDRSIRAEDLCALLHGEASMWSDGSPRVFLSRERGDSSHRVVALQIPCFREAERGAQDAARFRVLYTDVELRFALLSTPGAVGLTDLGATSIDQLPLVPLALDGVAPTLEHAASGRYSLVKPLIALMKRDAGARAASFVEFATGEQGRAIIEASGFLSRQPRGAAP
jgi:phosphate transport system substrate-binding protein